MATARIVQDEVAERTGTEGFTGHVGGDDLVVVVAPEHAEAVAEGIIRRFDEEKDGFYDLTDLERGYLETPDRQGNPQRYPLVAVSIGIATSEIRRFEHYAEVVAVAAEMKRLAKREPSSSFAIDRRGARSSRPANTIVSD
jgi:GGDEF domain-containing protein